MSCCGTSRKEEEQQGAQNRPPPAFPTHPVASQPGFQPSPAFGEKPYPALPLSPPPAVYQPAPHLGWNASPATSPPPPSDVSGHHSYNPYGGLVPPSPPHQGGFGGQVPDMMRPMSMYDGSDSTSPLSNMNTTFQSHGGGSSFAQAVATETRMSVAVDFGMFTCCYPFSAVLKICVYRDNILRSSIWFFSLKQWQGSANSIMARLIGELPKDSYMPGIQRSWGGACLGLGGQELTSAARNDQV
jgi:hypothetical protein